MHPLHAEVRWSSAGKNGSRSNAAMAQMAATFLALDRLILTDRFADFIRRFTLRAAATRFSPRDADQLFRRYDDSSTDLFGQKARRVLAGLERLFYVSPFDVEELV